MLHVQEKRPPGTMGKGVHRRMIWANLVTYHSWHHRVNFRPLTASRRVILLGFCLPYWPSLLPVCAVADVLPSSLG